MSALPDKRSGIFDVAPPGRLVWSHWEADSSVYNRGTGETHLLGPLPTEIVNFLERTPLTLTQLSCAMAELCDTDDSPAWKDKLQRILRDLVELEIVDRRHDGT